ncbi:type IV secretory system conjugative DNA transfer family protein [Spirosoma spitsbergense]|uniref:type IV secretory system conjugative DNA transfer family protein n=1 Tax=Spirosoma spitsbergense TaxID=431554 RepID=UPI00146C4F00|nr:type IV secretory system conjugative DNA transfer family protein [Spirosoma spitsbergense]
MVFTTLGLHNTGLAKLADVGAFGAACYVIYLLLVGRPQSGPTVGKASTTTQTGRKVQQSVYIIETHTPAVPRINLVNPFRGVLILGGAGAGKSKSLIEPIISQTIAQGYTGLLYDFKFPTLARVAARARQQDRSGLGFYFVNFEDLTRSHRVNPLHPATMPTQSHADEYARAILFNLRPEAIKKPDFWTDSAQSYLTALIWFLREEHPQYCTLPHVMALAFQPTADVVALLSTNPETRGTIASLRESVQRKAEGQTAGVVSTLQTALRKINTKEIVWVLSGDDFNLNINDPENPKFVTLGNSPTLSSTFAPVIALLATVALKQMNQQDKAPSAVILDEAPTLFIPNFDQLPATGRSNRIATVYGAQDVSQIEDMYGRSKKDALLANLNNQFYGRVGHRETAQYISDLWGKEDVQQRTEGQSESSRRFETTEGRSVSHSYTERSRVRIQDVLDLNTGEFYGQLVESDFSSFKAQVKAIEGGPLPEIVPVTIVTNQDTKQNFLRIQQEIETLLYRQQPHNVTKTEPPKNSNMHNGQAKRDELTSPGENLDF